MRAIALAVVFGAIVALCPCVTTSAAAADAGAGTFVYEHPVDAEIVDAFRPPLSRFGPGNRGVDYETVPGDPITASAPGIVRFVGQVGGVLHITIEHPDGRLSSYSGVGEVLVRLNHEVGGGELIGRTSTRLHFGLREGGHYIDPQALIGAPIAVRLVPESPVAGSGWTTPGQEAAELRRVAIEFAGRSGLFSALGGMVRLVGSWAGWTMHTGGYLLGSAFDGAVWLGTTTSELAATAVPIVAGVLWHVAPYALAMYNPILAGVVFNLVVPILRGETPPLILFVEDLIETPKRLMVRTVQWWHQRSRCTPSDVDPPRPSGDRVAVLVAGLDSTSSGAAISTVQTDDLGYDDTDVIGFSYAGGRTPGRFDDDPDAVADEYRHIAVTEYGRDDSSTDLASRGALLADMLSDIAAADPDGTIDLYAHSQGGIVVRLAIDELSDRPGGHEVIDRFGLVATMGSPHEGADLATMSVALSTSLANSAAIRLAGTLSDTTLHPRGTNVADLARGSDLLDDLDAEPLPEGPTYLTLANRGDLVVTDARARLDGAHHVTLGGAGLDAHGSLPGQDDTTRELALGLAGMDPTCQSLGHFLIDVGVSELHQLGTSAAGTWAATVSLPILPTDVAEPLVRW